MTVVLRIARWQRPSYAERAQELARQIELEEAPLIALYHARVKANELRRQQLARLAAAARFVEPPSILRRRAI